MLCPSCGKHEATVHETRVEGGKLQEVHLCPNCATERGIDPGPPHNLQEMIEGLFLVQKPDDDDENDDDDDLTPGDATSLESEDSDAGQQPPKTPDPLIHGPFLAGPQTPVAGASGSSGAKDAGADPDAQPYTDPSAASDSEQNSPMPPLVARIQRPTAPCPTCSTSFEKFKSSGRLGCPDCYAAFEPQLIPLLERAHEGSARHVGKLPKRTLDDSRRGGADRMAALLGDQRDLAERVDALRRQLAQALAGEHFERASQLRDELRSLGVDPASMRVKPGDATGPKTDPEADPDDTDGDANGNKGTTL